MSNENLPTADENVESLIERQQRLIEDQTKTIAQQQATIKRLQGAGQSTEQSPLTRRSALKAGGLVGLLGLGATTASASDPTGQVGTADRPIEALYAAGLNGPLTGGQELTSLVGDGLEVADGALTAEVEPGDGSLAVASSFDIADNDEGAELGPVDVTVFEFGGEETETLEITLEVVDDQTGGVRYDETIEPDDQLELDATTVTFGEDGGTSVPDLPAGEYTATATADAENADPDSAETGFRLGVEIEDWNDLDDVRTDTAGDYVLVEDLTPDSAGYDDVAGPDANDGRGFEPIPELSGSIGGDGNTIEGVTIDRPAADRLGLFEELDGAEVRSLALEALAVTGEADDDVEAVRVGGLAAVLDDGTVENCSVNGTVTVAPGDATEPATSCGGLLGETEEAAVVDSEADVAMQAYNTEDIRLFGGVGGLVGFENDGRVDGCHATGTVENTSPDGEAFDSADGTGGLIGATTGETLIRESSTSVDVEGENAVGGLTGDDYVEEMTDCYATGDVEGTSWVGGLVGIGRSSIETSYATGEVTGEAYVGGVVGRNLGEVSESYATGAVDGGSNVGGLVGENVDTVTESYWDVPATGQEESDGGTPIGDLTDEPPADGMIGAVEGLDDDLAEDFDFEDTWEPVSEDDEDAGEDDYPVLQALDRETQLEVRE